MLKYEQTNCSAFVISLAVARIILSLFQVTKSIYGRWYDGTPYAGVRARTFSKMLGLFVYYESTESLAALEKDGTEGQMYSRHNPQREVEVSIWAPMGARTSKCLLPGFRGESTGGSCGGFVPEDR